MKNLFVAAILCLLATGAHGEYWTVDGQHLAEVKVLQVTASGVKISCRNPNPKMMAGTIEMTVPFEKLSLVQQASFKRELQKIQGAAPEKVQRTPGTARVGINVSMVTAGGVIGEMFAEKFVQQVGGAGTNSFLAKTGKKIYMTGVKDIAPGEFVEGECVEGAVVVVDGESYRSWKMTKEIKRKH